MVCSLKSEVFWPTLMTFLPLFGRKETDLPWYSSIGPEGITYGFTNVSQDPGLLLGFPAAPHLSGSGMLACNMFEGLKRLETGWNGLKRVETGWNERRCDQNSESLGHPSTSFGRTTTATPFCTIGVAFAQNIWRPPRLSTIASAKQVDAEGRNRDLGGSNPIPLWLGLYV